MLNQAYTAIEQFQRQISDIHSIQQLKVFLKKHKIGLSIRISSPTVWILDWNVTNNTLSGTLELRLEPTLSINNENIPMVERSFLLQEPKPNSLIVMEKRLIEFIRKSVKNFD
jgi:hypothetical protein